MIKNCNNGNISNNNNNNNDNNSNSNPHNYHPHLPLIACSQVITPSTVCIFKQKFYSVVTYNSRPRLICTPVIDPFVSLHNFFWYIPATES